VLDEKHRNSKQKQVSERIFGYLLFCTDFRHASGPAKVETSDEKTDKRKAAFVERLPGVIMKHLVVVVGGKLKPLNTNSTNRVFNKLPCEALSTASIVIISLGS